VHKNDFRRFYIPGSQFSVIARVQTGEFEVCVRCKRDLRSSGTLRSVERKYIPMCCTSAKNAACLQSSECQQDTSREEARHWQIQGANIKFKQYHNI